MKHFFLTISILSLLQFNTLGQISLDSTTNVASLNNSAHFTLSGLNNDIISFNVYNRWGNLVINKTDTNAISGSHTFNIQLNEFPERGTYYYILNVGDSTFKGHITALYPENYTIEIEGEIISDSSYLSINISHLQLDTTTVIIYNLSGDPVITKIKEVVKYGNLQYIIENNDFTEDGIYFLNITINDSSYSKQLIVHNTLLTFNNTFDESKPNIFPNPFLNVIDLSSLANVSYIQLINENGNILWQGNDNNKLAIFMETISSGKYILKTKDKEEQIQHYTQLIIKL